MIVRAYAKINLNLNVLGKRSDGYHNIDSIMQTISLHDTLDIELTDQVGQIDFSIEMLRDDQPLLPADESNLCVKAARAFLNASGLNHGVSIKLRKLIPSQAGLGGGSSDAASILIALNKMTGQQLEPLILVRVGSALGADVPFFLIGGTCRITGIGEQIEPLVDIEPIRMIVVKPGFGVSTPLAYTQIDELRANDPDITIKADSEIEYHNDFDAVISTNHPEPRLIKNALKDIGCDKVILCGSGSAYAGLLLPSKGIDGQQRLHDTYNQALDLQARGQLDGEIYPSRTISRAISNLGQDFVDEL